MAKAARRRASKPAAKKKTKPARKQPLRRASKPAALSAGYHHGLSMDRYLADPCPEPALSTGIVQALLEKSPLHAHDMHPRFGGNGDEPTARGDLGSAVHSAVLGGAEVVYAPPAFTDWRKGGAQDFRDEARAAGKLPLLAHQRVAVETAAGNARRLLDKYGPGKAEVTMTWAEGGVWCRARADWLTDDGSYDWDIKTTESACPGPWIKSTLIRGKAMLQAGLRARGHTALGRTRDVGFLLVEIVPPFAVSLVGLEPALADYADRQVQKSVAIWSRCLESGAWPSYSTDIHYAGLPGWLEYSDAMIEAA
jgi:hypothetical protein